MASVSEALPPSSAGAVWPAVQRPAWAGAAWQQEEPSGQALSQLALASPAAAATPESATAEAESR